MYVYSLEPIDSKASLLLTSGGVTTEAMSEKLLEMGRAIGRLSQIRILRIADGWQPFHSSDKVTFSNRLEQTGEHLGGRIWSSRYLHWVLGKNALINTESFGKKTELTAENMFDQNDMLLLPGGNTYQLIRGLDPHRELVKSRINGGLPTVTESAGSIIIGKTIKPATLAPADTCPETDLLESPGLSIVSADILAHVKSDKTGFDIKGPKAWITKRILASVASSPEEYTPDDPGTKILELTETQAYSVSGGVFSRI